MWLYLILFLIPCLAYVYGGQVNRNKNFLKGYCLLLAFFVGMSDMFGGYDRYIYGEVFDGIADSITQGFSAFSSGIYMFFEPGFSFLSFLIALITENRYIYILILTLIIYYNIYLIFERHISNYPFAFILFMGLSFFFTFTYLRQVLAYSIAWLGIRYLLDEKKGKFLLVLLVTALMHKSGIVFSALLFMPMRKWRPAHVCWILLGCAVIGFSGIASNLFDMFTSSGLASSGNNYDADGQARIAYILEVVFFVWLILKNYDRIEDNRQNLIFLNISWLFCAMLLLFVRSSDGGRVAWYFTIGIIYTLTNIVSSYRTSLLSHAKITVANLLIIVMLLLYVRIFYAWQVYDSLYPYKTFLTNGRRIPDYVYDYHEYDSSYERNKFYRPAFRLFK